MRRGRWDFTTATVRQVATHDRYIGTLVKQGTGRTHVIADVLPLVY